MHRCVNESRDDNRKYVGTYCFGAHSRDLLGKWSKAIFRQFWLLCCIYNTDSCVKTYQEGFDQNSNCGSAWNKQPNFGSQCLIQSLMQDLTHVYR